MAKRAGSPTARAGEGEHFHGSTAQESTVARTRTSLPPSIPPSSLLGHVATARFFYHYLSPQRSFFQLDLNIVSELLRDSDERGALAQAIICMGVMTLPAPPDVIQRTAMSRYVRALRYTNKMLQSPARAASDEALLSVILLGLYETIPGEPRSEESYQAQVRGAIALLRLRPQLLNWDVATYRIFNHLRIQVITRCFQSKQPVPHEIVDFSEDAFHWQQSPVDRAADRLAVLFAKLADVLAHIATKSPIEIIREATALRLHFLSWPVILPLEFHNTQVVARSTDLCYSGICYVYMSPFYAEVWTLYRVGLCTLTSLLISMYGDPSGNYHKANIAVLQAICSTIPFLMDCHGPQPTRTANLPLRCRTPALHYLHFVLQLDGTPEDMHEWAQKQIQRLEMDEGSDEFAIWMDRIRNRPDSTPSSTASIMCP